MAVAPAEVVEFTKDYLRALVARDTARLRANSVDEPESVYVGIGSLPDESWSLPDLIDHLGEFPPTEFVGMDPGGFVEGDVAWLTDYPTCVLPSGEAISMRATVVLRRVGGAWKAVHWHLSEGVPHEL
jgi:hypothetical protein